MDVWLIDSGASRHLTGFKEALSDLIEKDTNLEIILGDNATYPVKGTGTDPSCISRSSPSLTRCVVRT